MLRRTAIALSVLIGAAQAAVAQTAPADALIPSAPPVAPAGPSPGSAPTIKWRVENPFRFFVDPADTEMHRATWQALSADERTQPVLSAERALQIRHEDGWAAPMFRKTCWNDKTNRHACEEGSDYVNPESHAVIVEAKGIDTTTHLDCTWLTAPLGTGQPRGKAITLPCSDPVRLEVPYPDGLDVSVEVGGRTVADTRVRVTDILIAAVGDSFGSGEGNPDQAVRFSPERAADYGKEDLAGLPARVGSWATIGDSAFIRENALWMDQACHRSLYSHQLRAALQLAIEDPHRAVTYVGVACSGAEVTAGLFLRYKGHEWVPNPPELSQISSLAEAQCGLVEAPMQDLPEAYHMQGRIKELQGGLVLRKCDIEKARKIDLLFVSIGGNDVGFARLVANAVLADETLLKRLGGWFGQVQNDQQSLKLIEGLKDRYKSLNRAVHSILHVPWDESDRVILTAYPGMALIGDGSQVCPDGRAGMDVMADFRMSEQKVREGERAAERLQKVMASAAKAYGWRFATAHRPHFVGRGVCAGYVDNAFSIADDLRIPRKSAAGVWEPYNPSEFRAYASRQRWFRTPNDAFMTGNFHVAGSLMQKAFKKDTVSWFQLLLASTYSGAFHPTAEGHAAIADSVVDEARAVIDKYSRRRRAADAR